MPNTQLSAGSLLLLYSSGLHLAWNLWQVDVKQAWANNDPISSGLYLFVIYFWFQCAIVGSVVGAILAERWKKKSIYNLCGILLAIAGLIFSIWGAELVAVIVSRFLSGAAHGVLYVIIVSHTGENCLHEMRGRQLSVFAVILTAAGFTVTACIYIDELTGYGFVSIAERKIGFVMLVFAIAGLVLNYRTIESVPFLLYHGRKYEADETLMKARGENGNTTAIQNEMEEIRLLLSQDKMENRNIISNGNLKPLIILIILKLQAALTNNATLNMMLVYITNALLGPSLPISVCAMILTGARFIATIVPVFVGDALEQRWLLTWSGASAAITLLLFIILLMAFQEMVGFLVLLLAFQTCVGFGVEPMQHVYASEMFSMHKKAGSVAFASCIEYALQIVATFGMYLFNRSWNPFVLATSVALMVTTAILRIILPETRGLSLRRCREAFRRVENINEETPTGHDLMMN